MPDTGSSLTPSDAVLGCAISDNLEKLPELIKAMQDNFGDQWGGLDVSDAIPVLNSAHSEYMQVVVLMVTSTDVSRIEDIAQIVMLAKQKRFRTIVIADNVDVEALNYLDEHGTDVFLRHPISSSDLSAALAVTIDEPTEQPSGEAPMPTAPEQTQNFEPSTNTEPNAALDSSPHNFGSAPTQPEDLPAADPVPAMDTPAPSIAQTAPVSKADMLRQQDPLEAEGETSDEADKPSPMPSIARKSKGGVIFPIFGLAGGAGATTFACNLAWELQSVLGKEGRVCIIDLGMQFGSVATYLETPRSEATLDLYGSLDVTDAEGFLQTLSLYKETLAVLPAPAEAVPLEIINAQQVGRLLDLAASQYDYVVVDIPHALTSWTETVLDRASLLFALAQLDMRSAQNTVRFLRALKSEDLPYEKVQFILNNAPKITDINTRGRIKRMSDSLNIEFRWMLPNGGPHVAAANDQGQPLALTAARNPLRKELRKIAQNLRTMAEDGKAEKDKPSTASKIEVRA